jgi:hypothetical protein
MAIVEMPMFRVKALPIPLDDGRDEEAWIAR